MATSAGGIYSETLQSIIDAKLGELQRKRAVFEKSKGILLGAAANQSTDTAKLRVLVDGVKTTFGIRSMNGRVVAGSSKHYELEQKLSNLERFLTQPQYDPSVSPSLLADWERELHQQLNVQSSRLEYASLYAQLVTEWLAAEKKIGVKEEPADDLEMSGFEELESKQMLESRAEWAQTVFEPFDTDTTAITDYLKKLFGETGVNKQAFKALQALRKKMAGFQNELARPGQFNESVLVWVINGLLASDLLTEDKRNVLRDFLPNSIILNELADVLNLRISSIDTWSWGDRVPLEQKRKIQGHFHIIMHEDLLQAIFLQYIGVKWSVFLKSALNAFVNADGAWASAKQVMPLEDLKRREYYLGYQSRKGLQSKRESLWSSSYFLAQLPDSETSGIMQAEGEVEADFAPQPKPQTMQTARKASGTQPVVQAQGATRVPMAQQDMRAMQAAQLNHQLQAQQLMKLEQQNKKRMMARGESQYVDDDPDFVKRPGNPTQAKQILLHLLSTEILINKHLYGGLTAFRGQFASWNPLLPHSTILAILQYFGVSQRWMGFFRTFLEAPLGFQDEETVHHRKRGVPGSHPLSDMLGESVLFCLDLSVNQATNGCRLWRVYDDFWFWSVNDDISVVAWQTITQFSKLMGLDLYQDKCGGVRVGNDQSRIGQFLPHGTIRWGFLYLDPKSARFEIDQEMINRHVGDLKRQLRAKTSSIFSWIEAWNAYADKFFTTNFGKPVNCFGQAHIDHILSTLQRAQRKIFEDEDNVSSVVEYLKATLSARFGISDIPEGYVFFPSALGGLELRNPFVIPLQLRDAVLKSPERLVALTMETELEEYHKAKKRFESGSVPRAGRHYPNYVPANPDTFFSYEEYSRYREEFQTEGNYYLAGVFLNLMRQPDEESITASTEITTALNLMDRGGVVGQAGKCGINGNWYGMQPYWKWILGLHGPEVLRRFGGLNIVDNGVLPIGMVSLFRSQSIPWAG